MLFKSDQKNRLSRNYSASFFCGCQLSAECQWERHVVGERYGMGSSRDWAAKGVGLLGVRAVLANSFERIHRSNLIGMGVLPLRLPAGVTPETLRLNVNDRVEIVADEDIIAPRVPVQVRIRRGDRSVQSFDAMAAIETSLEVGTLRAGGILPLILWKVLAS